MRLVVVALVAGMMASGGFLLLGPTKAPPLDQNEERVVEIGGGTVTYSPALQGGERFLEQVPLPDHLTNRYEPAAAEETPGDGHDDELLVTQRRHTDNSWWTKPITGRVDIVGVHGTAANPICICDVEFVLSNETQNDPTIHINVDDSSHILFDSIVVYGGPLRIDNVDHITISRSQFFNAYIGTFASLAQDILIWDNDFSTAEGPLGAFETDPLIYNPTGLEECWPNPSCGYAGIAQAGTGIRWTVMWNYFDVGGPAAFAFSYHDFHVEHNTIMHPDGIWGGYHGNNYVGWNLMRGFGNSGIEIGASGGGIAIVENNSVVLTFDFYLSAAGVSQEPGVRVRNACICTIRYNDFVGYGARVPSPEGGPSLAGGSPALHNLGGTVIAADNYWGTIHDPTLPPDVWIRTNNGATTTVHRWFTEPIHPITPIVYPLNDQDAERWLEEAPKRVGRTQQHLEAWVAGGCEVHIFELCEVPVDGPQTNPRHA